MMYVGIKQILKPLVVLGEVIPFFGTLLNMGGSLFSGAISIVLSFFTISIAWVFHSPILGITLLVIALIISIIFFLKANKIKQLQ